MTRSDTSDAPRRPHLLAAPAWFLVGLLALLSLSRLGLSAWLGSRVAAVGGFPEVLLSGVRMDLVVLCSILLFVVPLLLLFGGTHRLGRTFAFFLVPFFTAWAWMFVFLEVSTPAFVDEYDARPNRLFLEYLVHPREIGSMLLTGYKLQLALGAVVSVVTLILAWRFFAPRVRNPRPMSIPARAGWLVLLTPLILLGARSSLQHRPANPSSVAFSGDRLVNELALSSGYSVLYAAYQMKDEEDAGALYGSLGPVQRVYDEVRAAMTTVAPEDFVDPALPTLHRQVPSVQRERPLNLVIVLEESLGSQYVGALGGRPITRCIDELADEGWWFEHMHATGTRSVRGIEAVVSGFLPTPGRSVVKLGKSQSGFFTLAQLLKRKGYHTQFVYGGESHFDNMASFFLGNGFEEIVDEDDYEHATFHGSWGVCDEDIFQRAHEGFLAMGDEPFFSLVFSVSNHSPYEYPAGRITPNDDAINSVENGVRYADYAFGKFVEQAKASPYWKNTVFLVVADHDSRVYGASLVPIEHFRIPAVIFGGPVEPRRDARLASQIDLPPTLLSLMGIESEHPMIGHDLTKLAPDAVGRAIMQYGPNQAYFEGGRAIVLQPHKEPIQCSYDGRNLVPMRLEPAFRDRALAHALLPSVLYSRRTYAFEPAVGGAPTQLARTP